MLRFYVNCITFVLWALAAIPNAVDGFIRHPARSLMRHPLPYPGSVLDVVNYDESEDRVHRLKHLSDRLLLPVLIGSKTKLFASCDRLEPSSKKKITRQKPVQADTTVNGTNSRRGKGTATLLPPGNQLPVYKQKHRHISQFRLPTADRLTKLFHPFSYIDSQHSRVTNVPINRGAKSSQDMGTRALNKLRSLGVKLLEDTAIPFKKDEAWR
jgi:hypothetical protein